MKPLCKILFIALLALLLPLGACASTDGGDLPTNGDFSLQGVVRSVGDTFEVEMTDSEVAFGTYIVITHTATAYYDKNGNEITREDIGIGDCVTVKFNGQVMRSMPPQIVAYSITLQ